MGVFTISIDPDISILPHENMSRYQPCALFAKVSTIETLRTLCSAHCPVRTSLGATGHYSNDLGWRNALRGSLVPSPAGRIWFDIEVKCRIKVKVAPSLRSSKP